eukprot:TRINITY_DN33090_c0_g1_i1.p1 TRINITY_DN33090_c0_g1~~TRINITY_DN33090_c0_g1_i1.p1  ORF type:complete len:206 (-),score=27.12 TRINITY_DN33090_c0_g1_i1:23-640(-)
MPFCQVDFFCCTPNTTQVRSGVAGVVMFGGWESFHGTEGKWDGTPLGNALPVEILNADDRLNCDQPLLVAQVCGHPTVMGLPWSTKPPLIGGLNQVKVKQGAKVVLEAIRFSVEKGWHGNDEKESFQFKPTTTYPLLVVGTCGKGRVSAFMTDVAPHWVGPLVDWGTGGVGRINAKAEGGAEIEVGTLYAKLLWQILGWTADLTM